MFRPLLAAGLLALSTTPLAAQDATVGYQVFQDQCATCHGMTARGGGPMAGALNLPVPDLSQLSAENGGAFPTLRVMQRIDGRDPLLAHGGMMPIFGHGFDLQQVAVPGPGGQPILTSRTVADLAAWLEQIQQ